MARLPLLDSLLDRYIKLKDYSLDARYTAGFQAQLDDLRLLIREAYTAIKSASIAELRLVV
jgi:hypothetical protein